MPAHVAHGSSTISPRPKHSRQGSANANPPALRLWLPVPLQTGHTRVAVPGLAPLPLHVGQVNGVESCNGTVTPSAASVNDSVTSASRSLPRRAACGARPREPPKIVPKMSPIPPPPPLPPNRSLRSNGTPCPLPPRGTRKPPAPNNARASSYSLRLVSSESTS